MDQSKIIFKGIIVFLFFNANVSFAFGSYVQDSSSQTAIQAQATINSSQTPNEVALEKKASDKAQKKAADAQEIKSEEDLKSSPVMQRLQSEEKAAQNPFAITFYKPTYVLPYYYTASPDNAVYMGETPENESLKKSEVKYQLSFKIPLWHHIANLPTTLFFAYTQMSYWQLYDRDPFFRETDYEPEFFLTTEVNLHLISDWHINFLTVGAVHQSNGYGGSLERSWNRVFVSAIASSGDWAISVRPWYVFHDATYNRQNPNMAKYLGYGQLTVAYKYYNQVFAIEARNFLESGGRRAAATATWSFPINKHLKGYLQVFSGYGQSLIEYNHRTNSVGIGFALSNWI